MLLPLSCISKRDNQQNDRSIGVALVGLGNYSTGQLGPAFTHTRHCHLAGIVTGSPEKIPVWQEKYGIPDGNVYNYENMHQIANNDSIDVVYIVLPNSMHAEYAIKGAEAGKHVWCEKPMAVYPEECEAMIEACKKNKRQLAIGYRMQHEPNTQTIIKYASEKPYGKIDKIIAEAGFRGFRDKSLWRTHKDMGGGALYDMGVYSLNGARYSTGEEPVSVTAYHEVERPEIFDEVDETTYFTLEFPSGAIAECRTSFGNNWNLLRIECEDGWYQLQPFQSYTGVKGETSDGKMLDQTIVNEQAKQMDDDALSIINNTPALVPGEEGLRDVRIVRAIYESAANSSKKIELGG